MPYCHYHEQDEEALCKAHIIPKCFYNKTKPHQSYNANGTIDAKHYQNGCKDNNIICKQADNLIGQYDEEAFKILKKNIQQHQVHFFNNSLNKPFYYYFSNEFNYKKLRLFFISLIWRASISSAPEFKNIKLSKKYEHLALQILKEEVLDNPNLFHIFVSLDEKFDDTILATNALMSNSQTFVFKIYNLYIIIVPEHNFYIERFNSLTPKYFKIYGSIENLSGLKNVIEYVMLRHTHNKKGVYSSSHISFSSNQ